MPCTTGYCHSHITFYCVVIIYVYYPMYYVYTNDHSPLHGSLGPFEPVNVCDICFRMGMISFPLPLHHDPTAILLTFKYQSFFSFRDRTIHLFVFIFQHPLHSHVLFCIIIKITIYTWLDDRHHCLIGPLVSNR